VDDLLLAHGIMTRGLVEELGMFRARPIGVVDNEGRVLHFGTLPQYGAVDKVSLRSALPTKKRRPLASSGVFYHPFQVQCGRRQEAVVLRCL